MELSEGRVGGVLDTAVSSIVSIIESVAVMFKVEAGGTMADIEVFLRIEAQRFVVWIGR